MFRFFRKLRSSLLEQGKLSSYLAYALGEIVLVVIGILLALQINNWNTRVGELRAERVFYKDVLDDLEKDRNELLRMKLYQENRIENASWLLGRVRNPDLPVSGVEFRMHSEPLYYGPIPISYGSSFDAAKSAGAFSGFTQKDLLQSLIQYYADYEELRRIYQAQDQLIEEVFEPLMAPVTNSYFGQDIKTEVLTWGEDQNAGFYELLKTLKDTREIAENFRELMEDNPYESYLIGDLGRAFNARQAVDRRLDAVYGLEEAIREAIQAP